MLTILFFHLHVIFGKGFSWVFLVLTRNLSHATWNSQEWLAKALIQTGKLRLQSLIYFSYSGGFLLYFLHRCSKFPSSYSAVAVLKMIQIDESVSFYRVTEQKMCIFSILSVFKYLEHFFFWYAFSLQYEALIGHWIFAGACSFHLGALSCSADMIVQLGEGKRRKQACRKELVFLLRAQSWLS